MDVELLKQRMVPVPTAVVDKRLLIDPLLWERDDLRLAAREDMAQGVSRSYVAEHLQLWVRGGALERLEKLRHTDIPLGSEGGVMGTDLTVKLRLSERVRLRVGAEGFERDILYDPLKEKVWMNLFQIDAGDGWVGWRLTNTYRLDEASSSLILRMDHRLR